MKIGDKVTFKGRTGKIVAFMPGDMVDVQFDDVGHVERRAKNLLSPASTARSNPRKPERPVRMQRKPRYIQARSTRRNPTDYTIGTSKKSIEWFRQQLSRDDLPDEERATYQNEVNQNDPSWLRAQLTRQDLSTEDRSAYERQLARLFWGDPVAIRARLKDRNLPSGTRAGLVERLKELETEGGAKKFIPKTEGATGPVTKGPAKPYNFLLDHVFDPLTSKEEQELDRTLGEILVPDHTVAIPSSVASVTALSDYIEDTTSGVSSMRGKSEGKAAGEGLTSARRSEGQRLISIQQSLTGDRPFADSEVSERRWFYLKKAAKKSAKIDLNLFKAAWASTQKKFHLRGSDDVSVARLYARAQARIASYMNGSYHPSDLAKLQKAQDEGGITLTFPGSGYTNVDGKTIPTLPKFDSKAYNNTAGLVYFIFDRLNRLTASIGIERWSYLAPSSWNDIQGRLPDEEFYAKVVAFADSGGDPEQFFPDKMNEAESRLYKTFADMDSFYRLYIGALRNEDLLGASLTFSKDDILAFLDRAIASERNYLLVCYDTYFVRQGRVSAYAQDLASVFGDPSGLRPTLTAMRDAIASDVSPTKKKVVAALQTFLEKKEIFLKGELTLRSMAAAELETGAQTFVPEVTTTKGKARRAPKTKRPTYYRKRERVSYEPKSAVAEMLKRSRASFFTRHDPLRASGVKSLCGNPLDGTAYYLVLNSAPQSYWRYITWFDVVQNTKGQKGSHKVGYQGALKVLGRMNIPIVYDTRSANRDEWLAKRWPKELLRYGHLLNQKASYPNWAPAYDVEAPEASQGLKLTDLGVQLSQGFVPDKIAKLPKREIQYYRDVLKAFRGTDEVNVAKLSKELRRQYDTAWINKYIKRVVDTGLAKYVDYASEIWITVTDEGLSGISNDSQYSPEMQNFLLALPDRLKTRTGALANWMRKDAVKESLQAQFSDAQFESLLRLCTLSGATAQQSSSYNQAQQVFQGKGVVRLSRDQEDTRAIPESDALDSYYRQILASGEPQIQSIVPEYLRLYRLKTLSEAWGDQNDNAGLSSETQAELSGNPELLARVQRFYRETRDLSLLLEKYVTQQLTGPEFERVLDALKERIENDTTGADPSLYTKITEKTDSGIAIKQWAGTPEILPEVFRRLSALCAEADWIDEQLNGPFEDTDAGDIWAPLRRVFSVLNLRGLFLRDLQALESALKASASFRAKDDKDKNSSVIRTPRLARTISQDELSKLLEELLVQGESEAYPIEQLQPSQDEYGRGRALDADPAVHFYVVQNGKRVFFRAKRNVFPGFDFVRALNPYAFREFRCVKTGTNTLEILVQSADAAGLEMSAELIELYLKNGMISVNDNVIGSETYEPIRYLTQLNEDLSEDSTIRIWHRQKENSLFYGWQKLEGPEAILDVEIPTADAVAPCADKKQERVARNLAVVRSLLYDIRSMFSSVASIVRNATQGEGGVSTGSEKQLDTLTRSFLKNLDFYREFMERLGRQAADDVDPDISESAQETIRIVQDTISEFKLDRIFKFALNSGLYTSARIRPEERELEDRVRGFRRRRQAKERKADLAMQQRTLGMETDTDEESADQPLMPLMEFILDEVSAPYRDVHPDGVNIQVPDPTQYRKTLPIKKQWMTAAGTSIDFLTRMIVMAHRQDPNVFKTTTSAYNNLNDRTYGAFAWQFKKDGSFIPELRHPMVGVLPFVYNSFNYPSVMDYLSKTEEYNAKYREAERTERLTNSSIVPAFTNLLEKNIHVPLRTSQPTGIFLRFRNSELREAFDLATKLSALGFKLYADPAVIEPKDKSVDRTPRSPIYNEAFARESMVNASVLNEAPNVQCDVANLTELERLLDEKKIELIVDTNPYLPAAGATTWRFRNLQDVSLIFENSKTRKLADASNYAHYVKAIAFPSYMPEADFGRAEKYKIASGVWDFMREARTPGVTPDVPPNIANTLMDLRLFAKHYGGDLMYSGVYADNQVYGDLGLLSAREKSQLLPFLRIPAYRLAVDAQGKGAATDLDDDWKVLRRAAALLNGTKNPIADAVVIAATDVANKRMEMELAAVKTAAAKAKKREALKKVYTISAQNVVEDVDPQTRDIRSISGDMGEESLRLVHIEDTPGKLTLRIFLKDDRGNYRVYGNLYLEKTERQIRKGDFVALIYTEVDPTKLQAVPIIRSISDVYDLCKVRDGLETIDALMPEILKGLELYVKSPSLKRQKAVFADLKRVLTGRDAMIDDLRLCLLSPDALLGTPVRAYIDGLGGKIYARKLVQKTMKEHAFTLDDIYKFTGSYLMNTSDFGANRLLEEQGQRKNIATQLLDFFGQTAYGSSNGYNVTKLVQDRLADLVHGMVQTGAENAKQQLERLLGVTQTNPKTPPAPGAEKGDGTLVYVRATPGQRIRPGKDIRFLNAKSYSFDFIPPPVWYYNYTPFANPEQSAREIKQGTADAVFRQMEENKALYQIISKAIQEYDIAKSTDDRQKIAFKWFRILAMAEMFFYFSGYESFGPIFATSPEQTGTWLEKKRQYEEARGFQSRKKQEQKQKEPGGNIYAAIKKLNAWIMTSYLGRPIQKKLELLEQKTTEYWAEWAKSGKEYTGQVSSAQLADFIKNQGVEVSPGEIARLRNLSEITAGGEGLRKAGQVAVFKTYNPFLFLFTRHFYPSLKYGVNNFLKNTEAVKALDVAGQYGALLELSGETALALKAGDIDGPDDLMAYRLGGREDDNGQYVLGIQDRRFRNAYLRNEDWDIKREADAESGQLYQRKKRAPYLLFRAFGLLFPLTVRFEDITRYWMQNFFDLPAGSDYAKSRIIKNVTRLRLKFEAGMRQALKIWSTKKSWADTDLVKTLEGYLALIEQKPNRTLNSARSIPQFRPDMTIEEEAATDLEMKTRLALSQAFSFVKSNVNIQVSNIQDIVYAWNKQALLYDFNKYTFNPARPTAFNDLLEFYGQFTSFGLDTQKINEMFDRLKAHLKAQEAAGMETAKRDAALLRTPVSALNLDERAQRTVALEAQAQLDKIKQLLGRFVVLATLKEEAADFYGDYPTRFTKPVVLRLLDGIRSNAPEGDESLPSFTPSDDVNVQIYESSIWRRLGRVAQEKSEERRLISKLADTLAPFVEQNKKIEIDEEIETMRRRKVDFSELKERYRQDEMSRRATREAYNKILSDEDEFSAAAESEGEKSNTQMNPRNPFRRRLYR